MSTIVLRSVKGTPLTNTEVDTNFSNLNTDKLEAATTATLTNKTINLTSNTLVATSAQILAAITDETGTGSLVFATSPTLVTPTLGVATATSLQGIIGNVTPAAGNFTTLGASSTATLNTLSSSGATLTGGTINGMTVGATTASTGAFTTLSAGNGISFFNNLDANIMLRVGVGITSTLGTGEGLEFSYTAPQAKILSYNRATSAYKTLFIDTLTTTFGVSGTTQLTLNSTTLYTASGISVGIGLSNPNTTLHVKSTVAGSTNGLTLEYFGASSYYARLFSNGNDLYVSADTGNTGGKMFLQTAGTTAITVDASQNVGIGTNLPATKLHVSGGNIRLDNNQGVEFGGANNYIYGNESTDFIALATNGTEALRVNASQNVGIGTTTNTNSSKLVVNGTISQTVGGTQYLVVDQSDIGTGANEIPLNQYLGSLAYQNGDAYYNTGMTVGFRNRIINGAMMIDQRNAGALVSNANGFITDRWSMSKYDPTGGAYSGQQVSDAPTNFVNSLQVTVTTNIAQSSDAYWQLFQTVEGNNSADLGFGTATPSVFTVSFWVKSSVIGTYSIAIYNNGQGGTARSYVTTYTVNTASTWEYKTITITADGSSGSGFWSTTTGNGLGLYFDLGCGTAQQTTGNTWASVNARRIAGTVRLMATSGATFQVTGVQVEKGNIATSFDVRPYTTELQLCQRYYWQNTTAAGYYAYQYSDAYRMLPVSFPVPMRSTPTATVVYIAGSFTPYYSDIYHFKAYVASSYTDATPYYTTSAKFSSEL